MAVPTTSIMSFDDVKEALKAMKEHPGTFVKAQRSERNKKNRNIIVSYPPFYVCTYPVIKIHG